MIISKLKISIQPRILLRVNNTNKVEEGYLQFPTPKGFVIKLCEGAPEKSTRGGIWELA